jgi:hypothetical protein
MHDCHTALDLRTKTCDELERQCRPLIDKTYRWANESELRTWADASNKVAQANASSETAIADSKDQALAGIIIIRLACAVICKLRPAVVAGVVRVNLKSVIRKVKKALADICGDASLAPRANGLADLLYPDIPDYGCCGLLNLKEYT